MRGVALRGDPILEHADISGCGVRVSIFRWRDFGFSDSGFGFWELGFGIRVSRCGVRVQGSGCRVQGAGLRGEAHLYDKVHVARVRLCAALVHGHCLVHVAPLCFDHQLFSVGYILLYSVLIIYYSVLITCLIIQY